MRSFFNHFLNILHDRIHRDLARAVIRESFNSNPNTSKRFPHQVLSEQLIQGLVRGVELEDPGLERLVPFDDFARQLDHLVVESCHELAQQVRMMDAVQVGVQLGVRYFLDILGAVFGALGRGLIVARRKVNLMHLDWVPPTEERMHGGLLSRVLLHITHVQIDESILLKLNRAANLVSLHDLLFDLHWIDLNVRQSHLVYLCSRHLFDLIVDQVEILKETKVLLLARPLYLVHADVRIHSMRVIFE